ncbi:MAG TPA: four helix bundle protein [Terriglobales bacterium]|nr:four helix bundle protein [Terriglobales bacterium]
MNQAEALKQRTTQFALRILRLCRALPRTDEGRVVSRQLLRSATSVAANYRAVCRARSRAEFTSRLGVVVEEMDETAFWMDFLIQGEFLPAERLDGLRKEADELLAIFAASQRTAKGRQSSMNK